MKNIYLLPLLLITIFLNSCGKGPGNTPTPDACSGLSFKFATDVQPIINTACLNCHNANSTNSGGALTDYNKVFSKKSEIHFQITNGLMPKTGSLTADQKNKIICWINSGAPNN